VFLDPPAVPVGSSEALTPPLPTSTREVPPFARPPWRVTDLVLGVGGLLASLLLAFVLLAVAVAAGAADGDRDRWAMIVTIGFEASMAGVVLLLARRRGIVLRELGFRRPTRWGPLPVAWIGAYVMLGLYAALLVLLEELGIDISLLDEGNPLPVDAGEGTVTVVLLGIAVVIAAPFGEELFFRGLLFRGLRGYWHVLPALALSGLLFGLFHLNPSVLVPFTAVGMVFAWAMEQSGSLWTSIAAHAAFNSLAFGLHVAGV
jgi:membrane protease YdiL (CAAX protease family)